MISRPRGGLYTLGGRLRALLIPGAREAARAAEGYTEELLPAGARRGLHPGAAFLLGAAAALALAWALGFL